MVNEINEENEYIIKICGATLDIGARSALLSKTGDAMGKVLGETPNLAKERLQTLKSLFPEAFSEGKIDPKKLRELIDASEFAEGERYSFSWAGRSKAISLRDKPSRATLAPSRKESVEFDKTGNVFIEGDNLEALKILQKSYEGKLKMVYIDPPYNTGNDFVYPDDFSDPLKNYLVQTGQTNAEGAKTSTNTERSGRYHSNWLTMMYPRLALARNLLREDGVIFVSIDDNEVHDLRMIMNEIFGEENFLGIACRVAKKTNNKGDFYAPCFDYLVTFCRDIHNLVEFAEEVNEENYTYIEESGPRKGEKYQLIRLYMSNIKNENPEQRFYIECPNGSKVIPPGSTFPPTRPVWGDGIWRWTRTKCEKEKDKIVIRKVRSSNLVDENGEPAKWNVYAKTYKSDVEENASLKPRQLIEDFINELGTEELRRLEIPFDYPKPSALVKYLLKICRVNSNDIVLDFFAGSGTTAHAVLAQNAEDGGNRKFILVQLPEQTPEDSEARKAGYKTIADICKERVRRAIKKIKDEKKQAKLGKKDEPDLGFKTFKLSKSNCFVWDDDLKKDEHTLLKHIEDAAHGAAKVEDKEFLLYELMLREGFRLDSKVEQLKIGKNIFYKVGDEGHELWLCFDGKIDDDSVEKTGIAKDTKLVVFDSALTDTQKANLGRKARIETV